MAASKMDRKQFLATVGRAGVGSCACAAAMAVSTGLAGAATTAPKGKPATAPAEPGDKSEARAPKRMQFGDAWVPRLFQVMDEHLDEPTRRTLMQANGRACFSSHAKEAKPRPEPMTAEAVDAWFAERAADYKKEGDAHVFEFGGSAETGKALTAPVCLCPAAEAQSAKTISPSYCWCSLGYVKEMHERVFGRPVNVELLASVLHGDPRCRFRMTLA